MKTKKLITLSLLILIIGLGSYTIFNKQKKGIITETTATTKSALCSNEYYKTKYDTDGKIIIEDWPCYEKSTEEHPCTFEQRMETATLPNCCHATNQLYKIKGLSCAQKIKFGPSNWSMDLDGSNFEDISSFVNLEEIDLSNSFVIGDIGKTLKNFVHLKKFVAFNFFDYDIIGSESFRDLPELEYLGIDIWGEKIFDLKDISKTIKTLLIVSPEGGYPSYKNVDKLKDFSKLETLGLASETILQYKNEFCNWFKNWPNIKEINGIKIDNPQGFDCSGWINGLYLESQKPKG